MWRINKKWNMFITSVQAEKATVKCHTKSCRQQAFTAPANSSHPTAKQQRRPFLVTSGYAAWGSFACQPEMSKGRLSASGGNAKEYRAHLDKTRGAHDKKVGMLQTGMRTGWNYVVVELPSPAQGHHLCFLWCTFMLPHCLTKHVSSSTILSAHISLVHRFFFLLFSIFYSDFLLFCSFIYVSLGSLFSHFYPSSPDTITSGSESELWRGSKVILMRTSKLWALSLSEQLQLVPSQARGAKSLVYSILMLL